MEQKREAMNKNPIVGILQRASGPMTAKPISIKTAGCRLGVCAFKAVETYLGRSVVCLGIETEDRVIGPDRTAEVSGGRSNPARDEGPNGPRKGLMGVVSRQRDS